MTEPKEAYITSEEVTKAHDNWVYFHKGLICDESEERFFTYCHSQAQSFVDDVLDWDNGEETYHVAGSTAQRIKQLGSPHFHAILEAWYAKHPWK